jgi:hypothetical protein
VLFLLLLMPAPSPISISTKRQREREERGGMGACLSVGWCVKDNLRPLEGVAYVSQQLTDKNTKPKIREKDYNKS